MGFKVFFGKARKAQEVLKVLANTSQNILTNNTQSNSSSSSSDHEYSLRPRLHVKGGPLSSATKVDVQVLARDTFTTSSTVGTSVLGWKLRKAAPFLKRDRKHLSAKKALEKIHATSSPFVSSPKVAKIPPSVRILRQPALEMNKVVAEQVIQNDSVSKSTSPKSIYAEAPAYLATRNTPVSDSPSPILLEQQSDGNSSNTIEESIVWVSDAAHAMLGPSPVPDLLSSEEGLHQSNHTPGREPDISTEHPEDCTSTNSSVSSDRTSSSRDAAEDSTPFTPAEVDYSCARSRRYDLLGPVFEEQEHDEAPLQRGPETPCPPPRPAIMVSKTAFHTSPVAASHSHQFQFHVHASLAPIKDDTPNDARLEELQSFQENLNNRDNLNQGLRLQLLEREDEVVTLQEQLQTLQKERDMFAAEQDASSEQLSTMQQQLVTMKRQLADANTRTAGARRGSQGDHGRVGVNPSLLIVELDRARGAANTQFHRAQHFHTLANAATAERDDLAQHIAHMQAMTRQSTRQHEAEVMELRDRFEQARGMIDGLEQQVEHLVGLKSKAEKRVQELEVRVQSLLQDVTAKWIEDPVHQGEEPNAAPIKPNELRDFRQAFEISQARLAAAADVNQDLHAGTELREKELAVLRDNNNLLTAKAASLSSAFEIWMTKLENWKETLPGIAKMHDRIEDVPGLKELLDESVFHEQCVAKELKEKADLVSDLEATALKLEHEHRNEIEALNERAEDLQEENIRHDARNFELTDQLHESQQELEQLKDHLAQTEHAAEQWKTQCLEQAFGDTAQVIKRQHETQLKYYSDFHEALMHRCDRFYLVKRDIESDLAQFRWQVAEKLAGVAELGAERDWYRLQVEALRERFQHELLVEPLEIPYQPAYSLLSPEDKEAMMVGQDHVISQLTGALPNRANVRPRNIEVVDLWTDFVAWVSGEGKGDAEGTEKCNADPDEVSTLGPMTPPRRLRQSDEPVGSRSLDREDGSSWLTDDGSETTRSYSQAPAESTR